MLEVPDRGFSSWSWFEYGHWSLRHPWSKFWSISLFWKCKELLCPSSPALGLWMMLEVPDLSLTFWSSFGFGHWCLIRYYAKFPLFILIMKVQRKFMSFRSWFLALEDARGPWLGFGILTRIWIGSLVFDTTKFQILALHLDFKIQTTSMSFKFWFLSLEDAGGSW